MPSKLLDVKRIYEPTEDFVRLMAEANQLHFRVAELLLGREAEGLRGRPYQEVMGRVFLALDNNINRLPVGVVRQALLLMEAGKELSSAAWKVFRVGLMEKGEDNVPAILEYNEEKNLVIEVAQPKYNPLEALQKMMGGE